MTAIRNRSTESGIPRLLTKKLRLLGCLIVAFGVASSALAQGGVVVMAMTNFWEEDVELGQVRYLQLADSSEQDVLNGTVLKAGDELWSDSDEVIVRLACNDGTGNLLWGRFRAAVGASCALRLASGSLEVLTDRQIQNDVGGVVLGNEGTQYSVRLDRLEGSAVAEVVVFDGKVNASEGSRSESIHTGRTLRWELDRRLEGRQQGLNSEDVESSAEVYARADRAVSRLSHRSYRSVDLDIQDLEQLHARVLRSPDDDRARVDLARAQIELGVYDDAFYHLKRGDLVKKKKLKKNDIDTGQLRDGLSPDNRRELDDALSKGGFAKKALTGLAVATAAVLIHEAIDDDDASNPEDRQDPKSAECAEVNRLLGSNSQEAGPRSDRAIEEQRALSCHWYARALAEATSPSRGAVPLSSTDSCAKALRAHNNDHLLKPIQEQKCNPGESVH